MRKGKEVAHLQMVLLKNDRKSLNQIGMKSFQGAVDGVKVVLFLDESEKDLDFVFKCESSVIIKVCISWTKHSLI